MSHPAAEAFGKSGSESPASRRAQPRLSRLTRLFITVSVLTIVLRSALNTFMHHTTWTDELAMFTVPYPLPGAEERRTIARQNDDPNQHGSQHLGSLSTRLWAAGGSLLRFWDPLPTPKTALRLSNPQSWLRYTAVWVHTRLEFLGRLIGVDERWTMFSPSVGTSRTAVRAVLTYKDGARVEVRSRVEPTDFATFIRPFAQRRLQHDINLVQLEDVRLNWCRYLARTQATNSHDSPLQSIALHKIRHPLAPPGVDPEQHWKTENARPLPLAATWVYDVESGTLAKVSGNPDQVEASDGAD